ncbi:MAG TPA: class II aldolase/adducin family protein [Phycisphaeraceae bacterium]
MDEATLRRQVCQAVHQLWTRGLIAGDEGVVTAQLHRQRFLATPPHRRRADLEPQDLVCLDMEGASIQGQAGLDPSAWRPHRAAYLAGAEREAHADSGSGQPPLIRATILAMPVSVAALVRSCDGAARLNIAGTSLPVLDLEDEQGFHQALEESPVAALRSGELLACGPSLAQVLNRVETIEHAARIELILRSQR